MCGPHLHSHWNKPTLTKNMGPSGKSECVCVRENGTIIMLKNNKSILIS